MSFWSQVIGTIHVSYIDSGNKYKDTQKIIEYLKEYFGETFTFYNTNISELKEKCKVPYGTEGSIQYTISDVTDYSEHEKRSKWKHFKKEFNLLISFQGDLRDSNLLTDKTFKEWFDGIPVRLDFNEGRIIFLEKLFRVSDDLAEEAQYFYWNIGQ